MRGREQDRKESPGDYLWQCTSSDPQNLLAHFIFVYIHLIQALRMHDSNGWKMDFENWMHIQSMRTILIETPKTQTVLHANGASSWENRETRNRNA